MYTILENKIHINGATPLYLSKGLDFKGKKELLDYRKSVSIIGSRIPTEKGKYAAETLTKYFVRKDYTIISGMALGIDTIAHHTALELEGKTIAVIGTSIDKIYPKENKLLADRIIESGLMLSQFPANTPTRPSNFPQRNRTMAFLSDITVICDASAKSGTIHQAKEALKLGKKLYFMEHVYRSNIQWVNSLLTKGATVITNDKLKSLAL